MASWKGTFDRTQIIRGAARLLAIDRAIRHSRHDEWRLHRLAKLMLCEVDKWASYSPGADLLLATKPITHLDLNTQTRSQGAAYYEVRIHMQGAEPHAHARTQENPDPSCKDAANLFDDPTYWIDHDVYQSMAAFLSLRGLACYRAQEGPWSAISKHRVENVVLRAARAALACEHAHQEIQMRNPGILIPGRNLIGKTVQEAFIDPWEARFQELLVEEEILHHPGPDGKPVEVRRRFAEEIEPQWTLKLCWAIVKESRRIQLDAPPATIPLWYIEQRHPDLTVEQAVVQYLCDHPQGPRMRNHMAETLLKKRPGSVDDMLAATRRISDIREPLEVDEWSDWLANPDAVLIPTAMRK